MRGAKPLPPPPLISGALRTRPRMRAAPAAPFTAELLRTVVIRPSGKSGKEEQSTPLSAPDGLVALTVSSCAQIKISRRVSSNQQAAARWCPLNCGATAATRRPSGVRWGTPPASMSVRWRLRCRPP